VVNLGTMLIDMPVPEKEIADVRPGFPIALKVRGYPKLSFQGRVTTISPVALESGSERKVLVKSELANDEGLLKAGMTGVGKILCGKRMIAELLSRRAVRWLRTEFWEYLP
jgi:HlyD family secretion protein